MADKPNVLLFVADDLGVGDIKASGYMDENDVSTTRVSTALTLITNLERTCALSIYALVVCRPARR